MHEVDKDLEPESRSVKAGEALIRKDLRGSWEASGVFHSQRLF